MAHLKKLLTSPSLFIGVGKCLFILYIFCTSSSKILTHADKLLTKSLMKFIYRCVAYSRPSNGFPRNYVCSFTIVIKLETWDVLYESKWDCSKLSWSASKRGKKLRRDGLCLHMTRPSCTRRTGEETGLHFFLSYWYADSCDTGMLDYLHWHA